MTRTPVPALLAAATLAAAVASGVAVAAATGGDPTAQQAIAALNAERVANGLPGGIVEDPSWSAKCAAHDHYLIRNDVVTHPEDPTLPGYSADGNWAGTNSVLAYYPGGWTSTRTPWEDAPIHLEQVLAPTLRTVGVAVIDGRSCLTTWPGYVFDPGADAIAVFPGDGRTGVTPREVASELPFTPGQKLGIPAGTATGPYLFVYGTGKWQAGSPTSPSPWLVSIESAGLTGPNGPVEIKTVDRSNPDVGSFLPPGAGMIIPVSPLRPDARYTATVTMSNMWDTLTRSWSFTTGKLPTSGPSVLPAAQGSLEIVFLDTRAITLAYTTPAHRGTVRIWSRSRLVATRSVTKAAGRLVVPLPPGAAFSGALRACLTVPGARAVCQSTHTP